MSEHGVGAPVLRKEDDRLTRGRGQFVADLRLPRMQDVAFVRSPLAHANIRGIDIPPAHRGVVFTADDLAGVKPIRAVSGLPGFKISEQPPLAAGKVPGRPSACWPVRPPAASGSPRFQPRRRLSWFTTSLSSMTTSRTRIESAITGRPSGPSGVKHRRSTPAMPCSPSPGWL